MAAKSKSELLKITEKEFVKLRSLLEALSEEQALQKDEEATSIKDVVAHRAHWIGLFVSWYNDGQAGIKVHFPAEGYKWNELKRFNADLRVLYEKLTWVEAVELLTDAYSKFLVFIEDHSNDDLYGGPMKGAYNDWRPGRWAESAGPSHFRSASKYIRARLKSMK